MAELPPERIAALKELGRRFSERRLGRGLSLRTVAGHAGIAPAYLGILEKGENPKTGNPSRPSAAVLQNLARALEMDATQLLVLAGYPAVTTDPQSLAVASTLREGRVPAIFDDLKDIESNFYEYLDNAGVVETPVFAALSYFDAVDDVSRARIRIVGRTFRAHDQPAILYTLASRYLEELDDRDLFLQVIREFETNQRVTSELKIAVLGTAMTPTIMLLRYLLGRGMSCMVRNRERGVHFVSPPKSEATRVTIQVVYGGQIELLLEGSAHMALVVDPFRQILDGDGMVQEGFRRVVMAEDVDVPAQAGGDADTPTARGIPIDLWRHFRVAELPMNLICTTAERLQSKPYLAIDKMQALRVAHRTLREQEVSHAMGRLLGDDPLDDTHDAPRIDPVVKPFTSPYIYGNNRVADQSDVQELARSLECLASLGKAVGFLHHERSAAWYSKCIVPGESLDPLQTQSAGEVLTQSAGEVLQMRASES